MVAALTWWNYVDWPLDRTRLMRLSLWNSLKLLAEDKAQLDARLQPVSSAVQDWPQVELTEVTASYIRQGQPVQIANAPTTGWVSIFSESDDPNEEFIGVGEVMDDGRIAPRRLVVTN